MKLRLHEVPSEGQEYILNKSTGELNAALKDLVGDLPYEVKLFVRPLNHKDYELKGKILAQTNEVCSLCGENFPFKLEAKLNEILIPLAQDKDLEKQSRSNHFSELDSDGPSVTEYNEDAFDLGEFTHQAIALNIPYSPKPCIKDNGDCEVCLKPNMNKPITYNEDMTKFEAEKKKENPFNVLKNVKLN